MNLHEYDASRLLDEGLQGNAESMRDMLLSVSLGKMGGGAALTVQDVCHERLGLASWYSPSSALARRWRVEKKFCRSSRQRGKRLSRAELKRAIQSVFDESCLTKSSLLRNGGYSPSQWVLGKAPRASYGVRGLGCRPRCNRRSG